MKPTLEFGEKVRVKGNPFSLVDVKKTFAKAQGDNDIGGSNGVKTYNEIILGHGIPKKDGSGFHNQAIWFKDLRQLREILEAYDEANGLKEAEEDKSSVSENKKEEGIF